jgi:hypothetical protein
VATAWSPLDFDAKRTAADTAILGLFVCVAPFLAIAAISIVASFVTTSGSGVTFFRASAIPLVPIVLLLPHWLFAGLLGRGNVARLLVPNVLLGAILVSLVAGGLTEDFACSILRISTIRTVNSYGFDAAPYVPSPCDIALKPFLTALFVAIPITLYCASTIARVVISRKKAMQSA